MEHPGRAIFAALTRHRLGWNPTSSSEGSSYTGAVLSRAVQYSTEANLPVIGLGRGFDPRAMSIRIRRFVGGRLVAAAVCALHRNTVTRIFDLPP